MACVQEQAFPRHTKGGGCGNYRGSSFGPHLVFAGADQAVPTKNDRGDRGRYGAPSRGSRQGVAWETDSATGQAGRSALGHRPSAKHRERGAYSGSQMLGELKRATWAAAPLMAALSDLACRMLTAS